MKRNLLFKKGILSAWFDPSDGSTLIKMGEETIILSEDESDTFGYSLLSLDIVSQIEDGRDLGIQVFDFEEVAEEI